MVPAGKAVRFSNAAAGLKALIAWEERPVRAVTYERCHRPVGNFGRASLQRTVRRLEANHTDTTNANQPRWASAR